MVAGLTTVAITKTPEWLELTNAWVGLVGTSFGALTAVGSFIVFCVKVRNWAKTQREQKRRATDK